MKRGLTLAVLLILVVCIIVFEPFRGAPPKPEVKANGKDVPTVQGSYCWDSLLRSQCVDKIYRNGLDMTKEQKPVNVSAGAPVRIELTGDLESVKLSQWNDQKEDATVTLKNDQFNAPTEPGVYAYELNSRWKQGDGQFGFSLKVQ
ncbi:MULTISPECIES: hypothetical protein [Exiguobacterium]|uniref:hypothetical protein n=1 Tax=Exiguobacterium TaxID=33986 RepID=UPI0004949331|nr:MULTISPECIES: hypothetical protein [Exiguobacterium]HBQ77669.1 hypothetical protein [Exiguobacterium sp.]HCD60094.1 hypothetical protein [Exiguobacterium sp.]